MDNKKTYDRKGLSDLFKNGNIPTENDFEKLINSTLNLNEDGFSKNPEEGFVIKPEENFDNLLTFYKHKNDINPFFSVAKDESGAGAIKIVPYSGQTTSNHFQNKDQQQFYFHADGAMGIGQPSEENSKLSVNGFVSMQGRIGNCMAGSVPADGKWHQVMSGNDFNSDVNSFDGCQALEIIARVSRPDSSKHAILHAIATSAFGGKRSYHRIKKTSAYFGFFWNQIRIKWVGGGANNFWLEIKTASNYCYDGIIPQIDYRITKLWDDVFSSPAQEVKQS